MSDVIKLICDAPYHIIHIVCPENFYAEMNQVYNIHTHVTYYFALQVIFPLKLARQNF